METKPDQEKGETTARQENGTNAGISTGAHPGRRQIVIVIILAVLFACIGYVYQVARETGILANSVKSSVSENSTALEERIKVLNSTISIMDAKLISMARSLTEVYERQPMNNEDWALSEVEYLLIIASHRLLLEKDVATALSAIHAAEARLETLRSPDLIPVREQLVSDINQLEAVNYVDISGLAIYLGDLVERSADLPLRENRTGSALDEGDSELYTAGETDHAGSFKTVLATIWQELKSLVVIRKKGEVNEELLLPDQAYFLSQNLRLELENARLSVLLRDTGNLRTSVSLIHNWLMVYYDTADSAVSNILDTLEKTAELDLDPPLPDISSSLETLRAYRRNN